jgi:hypothetical protein
MGKGESQPLQFCPLRGFTLVSSNHDYKFYVRVKTVNTLAYRNTAEFTAVKGFIAHDPVLKPNLGKSYNEFYNCR